TASTRPGRRGGRASPVAGSATVLSPTPNSLCHFSGGHTVGPAGPPPSGDCKTTVTCAVPLRPPAFAVMVYGPPARLGAGYRPLLLRVPRPVSDQVKTGCVLSAAPNWS